jgi:hypothetical protein
LKDRFPTNNFVAMLILLSFSTYCPFATVPDHRVSNHH